MPSHHSKVSSRGANWVINAKEDFEADQAKRDAFVSHTERLLIDEGRQPATEDEATARFNQTLREINTETKAYQAHPTHKRIFLYLKDRNAIEEDRSRVKNALDEYSVKTSTNLSRGLEEHGEALSSLSLDIREVYRQTRRILNRLERDDDQSPTKNQQNKSWLHREFTLTLTPVQCGVSAILFTLASANAQR